MPPNDKPDHYRVTGRRMRGHLGAFTENLTRDETTDDRRGARRQAIAWAGEGFTVWLMERRDPVPGFTAPGAYAWATLDEFSPDHPHDRVEVPEVP